MAALGLGLVWLALAKDASSILWVLAPIAGFVALVVIHEQLFKERERRRRAARFLRECPGPPGRQLGRHRRARRTVQ